MSWPIAATACWHVDTPTVTPTVLLSCITNIKPCHGGGLIYSPSNTPGFKLTSSASTILTSEYTGTQKFLADIFCQWIGVASRISGQCLSDVRTDWWKR